ncbi:MAG: FkbM family methyltransferase [Dichotomicrobium sp.]
MTSNPADIPFGRFSLPPWRENLRLLAGRLPHNGAGRRMRSLVRRVATAGAHEPYDIDLFPSVRARVYPRTNLCEKRVFAAAQFYDRAERRALSRALANSDSEPFVFVDLGANVGVYTLWMVSEARRLGRRMRALAVEADPETFARLTTNLALSDADDATAVQCAVGARAGEAHILGHGDNRGQHSIAPEAGADGATVPVHPLDTLCAEHGLDRIDAMKVDLEGLDHDVLSAFFTSAPKALWPHWIVVEAGKQADAPVVSLCSRHGYRLVERTKLNAVFRRTGAGAETS